MNLQRTLAWATCLPLAFALAHCSDSAPNGTTTYWVPDAASGNHPGGGDDTSDGGGSGDDDGGIGGGGDDGGGDDDGGFVSTGPLPGNGCAGGACQNPTCKALGTPADPGTYPETGFDPMPSFIPKDTIIPTFDDVPDAIDSSDPANAPGGWTTQDLKFLAQNNMHADFFINTNNWCGEINGTSADDPDCQAAIVEILKNQNPGNHTIHHVHLGIAGTKDDPGCADTASCDTELKGVETLVKLLSGGARPHLTRFRAPYGEPFQTPDQARLAIAAPVVAKYAVEVDWNLDSGDSSCASNPCTYTGQTIAKNVTDLIGTAPGQGQRWGILLMHGTFKWTHDALPLLFGPTGYLKTHGFKLATVEDAICWKYGKHSWDIVKQLTGQARDPN